MMLSPSSRGIVLPPPVSDLKTNLLGAPVPGGPPCASLHRTSGRSAIVPATTSHTAHPCRLAELSEPGQPAPRNMSSLRGCELTLQLVIGRREGV